MTTISVIVPNFNHAQYLPTALDAILSSSQLPDEILVIDDCSEDESRKVIACYAARYSRIRVLYNARRFGAAATMNRGLVQASGEYVALLAADDRIEPTFLASAARQLDRHRLAGLCSGLVYGIDAEDAHLGLVGKYRPLRAAGYLPPPAVERRLRRHGNWIFGAATLYRRAAVLGLGGFDPTLGSYCDGFLHEAIALKHGVCFIPTPLAAWRRLPTSLSITAAADPDRALAQLERARTLMLNQYRHVFPPGYAAAWEKRKRASGAWQLIFGAQQAIERGVRTLAVSPDSPQTRLALGAVTLAGKVLRRLVTWSILSTPDHATIAHRALLESASHLCTVPNRPRSSA